MEVWSTEDIIQAMLDLGYSREDVLELEDTLWLNRNQEEINETEED